MRTKKIQLFEKIREWSKSKGIIQFGDVKTQQIKLTEEVGEISRAILKTDDKALKDGIGDAGIVLINLAAIADTSLEECLEIAYNEIKDRDGNMINGTFIKDE